MQHEPKIAILRWEVGHVPEGLMQLETMPGNSTNLDSYPFPVKLVEVPGANANTVIINGIFGAGGDTLFDVYSLAVCMWGIAIPLALLAEWITYGKDYMKIAKRKA